MRSLPLRSLKPTLAPLAGALIALTLLAGCGESAIEKQGKEYAKQAEALGKQMEEKAKQMEAAGKKAEEASKKGDTAGQTAAAGDVLKILASGSDSNPAVDFRELKALLPESLPNMKRTGSEGSKSGMMGMNVAMAKADYTGEGDKPAKLSIEIVDAGAMGAMGALAFSWVSVEMDKETQDGYEKTSTVNGQRVHEKFNKTDKSGELNMFVANRFVVNVKGYGMEMSAFKDALGKVDMAKLAAIKPKAAEAAK